MVHSYLIQEVKAMSRYDFAKRVEILVNVDFHFAHFLLDCFLQCNVTHV